MEQQDDEEIEQLLEEIPRATSAPQDYSDELHRLEIGQEMGASAQIRFAPVAVPDAAFDAFGFGLSTNRISLASHSLLRQQQQEDYVAAFDELNLDKAGAYISGTHYQQQIEIAAENGVCLAALQQQDEMAIQKQQVFLLQLQLEEERQRKQRVLQQYLMQQKIQERAANLCGLQAPFSSFRFVRRGHRQSWMETDFKGHLETICGSFCRYYAQGYCERGELCPYSHVKVPVPAKASVRTIRSVVGNNFDKHSTVSGTKLLRRGRQQQPKKKQTNDYGPALYASVYSLEDGDYETNFHSSRQDLQLQQLHEQVVRYSSLKEVEGRIYSIAKDQHGCRFLQRKFDEGGLQTIFDEIIDHIADLMIDPFGNYLVQKLLEVCSEAQRLEILRVVCSGNELISISLNMHGTRAVQKLIQTLKSPDQILMIVSSLRRGVVTLTKDLNGNHVIQRCLQRLGSEGCQFIFDAAAQHCVDIGTHRHGCCVLQRCVDFAKGLQKQRLVAEISANALVLSQDQYGNYVVQYILDKAISSWVSGEVMARLEGNYVHLSMQKFSSNVVEKCLKQAGEEKRAQLVHELVRSSYLGKLLQDPYANYVIQCALTVTKGQVHATLIEAIRPHLPALSSSPYGKRILSRANLIIRKPEAE